MTRVFKKFLKTTTKTLNRLSQIPMNVCWLKHIPQEAQQP